jgi:hypothetical protein
LAAAQISYDKTLIEPETTATDRQIDQLVYALCGWSEGEIALIEQTV